MLAVAKTMIGPEETAGELEKRLAELGAPLVLETIEALDAGTAKAIPQDRSLVTKAPKLRKEEGVIDWNKSAVEIHNLVRALNPWPLASTHCIPATEGKSPIRIIVHETQRVSEGQVPTETTRPGTVLVAAKDQLIVATGQGALALRTVQIPGKKPMAVSEFLRGNRIVTGDQMGESGG
jgi:methionyl-tRNA formyltransferase